LVRLTPSREDRVSASKQNGKRKRPRKLTEERAASINRKRDLVEGPGSLERDQIRVRAGRGQTVREP
jgi:hypothetical protein